MARLIDAKCRQCRREGCKLFLKGDKCTSAKCPFEKRPAVPGQHGAARKRTTQYGLQLREKQKVKRTYGILEKQFKAYYTEAARMKGVVGENMLSLIERRLDNVIYRMGIGSSRSESRQIVNHGHITVNGRKVNIPSFSVKVGDVVAIKENKQDTKIIKELRGMKVNLPKWLEFNTETLTGKVLALPKRDDVNTNISEHLIIELYSR